MSGIVDAADRVIDPVIDALDRVRRVVGMGIVASGAVGVTTAAAISGASPARSPGHGIGMTITVIGCAIPAGLLWVSRSRVTAARSVIVRLRAELASWATGEGRTERLDQIREPLDTLRNATSTWGRLRGVARVVSAIQDATGGVVSVSAYRDATVGLGVGGGLLLLAGAVGTVILVGVATVAIAVRLLASIT